MRKLILAAVVAAGLSLPASASEWQKLRDRLVDMEPVDHVGARAAWALYDCTISAARDLGSKAEPKLQDADWTPSSARPSVEQLAATAMDGCGDAEAKAAGVLPEPELAAIRANVLRIAMETITWTREERDRLRRE